MKHLLKKFEIEGLLAILALAFACISMWGCSSVWDESEEDVSRTRLIGYSGDSLVVYIEEKKIETCLAKPLGDDCSTREKGTRIVVDNFYTDENVWKSDKLKDQYVENVYDLVDDSTIIEFDKNNSRFYKWTLGRGSEDLGNFEWDGCSTKEKVGSIRPWGNGKWRLVGSTEDCGYAIVDVEKKKITGYEKLDEFAEGCSDLWLHEGVKYCVGIDSKPYLRAQNLYGVRIKREDMWLETFWLTENNGFELCTSLSNVLYGNGFIKILNFCYENMLVTINYSDDRFGFSETVIWIDGLYKRER
jgi:hypothetical protein